MKKQLLTLVALVAVVGCSAKIVSLGWEQPDPNGVVGWNLYVQQGTATNIYPAATTNLIVNVPPQSTVFVTATNVFGEESDPSNVITNTMPGAPVKLKKQ